MYSEIHQLKEQGLRKSQAARKLGINVKTVSKYWNVDSDVFAQITEISRTRFKKLDSYENNIVNWLKEFPDMSAAQIQDWLKERCQFGSVDERTIRRYVVLLRKKYNISKQMASRQYQSMPDPPPGKQLQVDFGQTAARTQQGSITVYGMGTVLSNSRYKYCEWRDRPLTTADLVNMLRNCFEDLGGVPEELVFDQDKLLAVSENYGDIIYTHEFEKFKQAMGFRVYLCRAADPESKGRVEAVIKYVKINFAAHRFYESLSGWNEDCLAWLGRTANQKRHGITKKVPAEVFALEKQYLRPVPYTIKLPVAIVTRHVRKDNTVLYNGNRYSVPIGTYQPGLEVEVKEQNNILQILELKDKKMIASHSVSHKKGILIQNTNHLRDHSKAIDELLQQTRQLLGNTEEATLFLQAIHHSKRRYVREQFGLLITMSEQHPAEIVKQAVAYCLSHSLYSAVDCRDMAAYLLNRQPNVEISTPPASLPRHLKVKTQHRPIAAYSELLGGAR